MAALYINNNGSNKALNNAYGNINGNSKEIFKKFAYLSSITAGSIIKFNTTLSGSNNLTDFIVLGTSYNNDTILLLQRYLYELRAFNSISSSEYNASTIDNYLSAEVSTTDNYRSKLDESIRNRLTKTSVKSYSFSNKKIININRDIFLPSYSELGYSSTSYSYLSDEGISYLDALKIAAGRTSMDDEARISVVKSDKTDYAPYYWMRSPGGDVGSNYGDNYVTISNIFIRPIISLSPTTLIDNINSAYYLIG